MAHAIKQGTWKEQLKQKFRNGRRGDKDDEPDVDIPDTTPKRT